MLLFYLSCSHLKEFLLLFTPSVPSSPSLAVYLCLPLCLCVKGQEMKRIGLWFQQWAIPARGGRLRERGRWGLETKKIKWSLSDFCVRDCLFVRACVDACDCSRVHSESRGKPVSSAHFILTRRRSCRALTSTRRRPGTAADSTNLRGSTEA